MEVKPVISEYSDNDPTTAVERVLSDPDHVDLHRALKARHITMIVVGGAIGTELIIGTGEALAKAGPAAILNAYAFVGFIVYLVMARLGKWLLGFHCHRGSRVMRYWFKYIILSPNQLTAGAMVISYWITAHKVNPGVWITIFLILIICFNYYGVRSFGEFEFWLSSFKVIVILGIILLAFILMLGGGPDHDRKGFGYRKNPGAFNTYLEKGDAGRFLALWSTMVSATFAYLGTELVGVTVGEAQNPRRTIPRAIKLTLWRILVFFVLSVLLVGTLVPYNDKKLAFAIGASSSAAASPFVVAIELSGNPVLSHIIKACILLFVFSAADSDL